MLSARFSRNCRWEDDQNGEDVIEGYFRIEGRSSLIFMPRAHKRDSCYSATPIKELGSIKVDCSCRQLTTEDREIMISSSNVWISFSIVAGPQYTKGKYEFSINGDQPLIVRQVIVVHHEYPRHQG